MKTLGIIITSDQYPQNIGPMVRAASAKGLAVRMHFTGSGVCLVHCIDLEALTEVAQITISRNSADFHRMNGQIKTRYAEMLARDDEMARLINECDRHVVL